MALPASLNVNRGEVFARTAATVLAAVAMLLFPSNSDLRRSLKSSRGRPHNWVATAASDASSAPAAEPASRGARGFAMIASTRRSSSSAWSCLGICFTRFLLLRRFLELCPQILNRAELELLYRAFASVQFPRNFPDTLLLGKTHLDHTALVRRQGAHDTKQERSALDGIDVSRIGRS